MFSRYDYLPYFYSRVFEYEGSPKKVWWQFFGDNGENILHAFLTLHLYVFFISYSAFTIIIFLAAGETVEIGNFDPKIATFWIDSGNRLFLSPHFPLHFSQSIIKLFLRAITGKLKGVLLESGSAEVFFFIRFLIFLAN